MDRKNLPSSSTGIVTVFLIAPSGFPARSLATIFSQEFQLDCVSSQSFMPQKKEIQSLSTASLKNTFLHFDSIENLSGLTPALRAAQEESINPYIVYVLPTISNELLQSIRTESNINQVDKIESLSKWLAFNISYLDRLNEYDCVFIEEAAFLQNQSVYLDLVRENLVNILISPPNTHHRSPKFSSFQVKRARSREGYASLGSPRPTNEIQCNLMATALLEDIPANSQQGSISQEHRAIARIQNCRRHASFTPAILAGSTKLIIYISENSKARGHIYRVSQMIQGLQYYGLDAFWLIPEEALQFKQQLESACLVVLHRCTWNKYTQAIYEYCSANGISTAFDIDDYLFDREIITKNYFHYYSKLDGNEKMAWKKLIDGYRLQLSLADYCFAPTQTLAQAMLELNTEVLILPNAYSPVTAKLSTHWSNAYRAESRGKSDSVTMGFMSGHATHDADFGQIAHLLFKILREHPHYILRIVGDVDLSPFHGQYRTQQLERRPSVEHVNFAFELANVDILLVPLELDNPFCDAKSPLKWFESAIAGTPAVCIDNPTYSAIIDNGINGFLCTTETDWERAITRLCNSSSLRRRIASQAKYDAEKFGIHSAIQPILSLLHKIEDDRTGNVTPNC
ncbi:MAG: glycosyltransferase [Halioglobus sp.]